MGKNSQARRAARSRARTRQREREDPRYRATTDPGRDQRRAHPPGDCPPDTDTDTDTVDSGREAAQAWDQLLDLFRALRPARPHPWHVAALTRLPPDAVDAVGESLVGYHVELLLHHGWQPVEVHRAARRQHPTSGHLVAGHLRRQLALHLATHADDTVDPRWRAQVDQLGGPDARAGSYGAWQREHGLDRDHAYATTVALLVRLGGLPGLRPLVPPPGAASSACGPGTASDPVLQKVRGLLAKAESTEFEAEAAALTSKAQELMTKHALDQAALHADRPVGAPSTIRLAIEAPYVEPKAALLDVVARAARCRAVFLGGLEMSEVVGFPEDLDAVELLFTSLLVQAQKALTEAGRRGGAGGRARSRGFRATFLGAYAHRIGERLDEANEHVMAGTTEDSAQYLPVLRSREEAIDEHLDREYGTLSRSSVRGSCDPAGATSGRLAADQAQLTSGHLSA